MIFRVFKTMKFGSSSECPGGKEKTMCAGTEPAAQESLGLGEMERNPPRSR